METRPADLSAIKALANPLRQRILRELTEQGPATSTGLAKVLGVTTGGTSYNLRVLAEHGFVEELPELAKGRQRWWQRVPQDLRMPLASEQSAELRAATDELQNLWLAEDLDLFNQFQRVRDGLGEWADAMPYSRGTIQVDLSRLRDFFEDYLKLLKRYQPTEAPAGSRVVYTRFVAFPAVGSGDD
jgi:DNA-binding MarR family transcriptional regulator